METKRIEMEESAKQSDVAENPVVSTAANRNILVVAPHGFVGDDDFTGIIAKHLAKTVDCSAVINVDYQKPESMDQTEPDYENNLADLNDWEHINGDETVKQLFLEPIKEFIAAVKTDGGHAIILFVHGIINEHIRRVAEKTGTYQEKPENLHVILGFGQGGDNYTANQKETILHLIQHLKSEGINAEVAPSRPIIGIDGKKKTYCAADPNCLIQNLYDPDSNVELIQLEIRLSGFRENRAQAVETGKRIGKAILKLMPVEKKDNSEMGKLIHREFWKTTDLKPHPLNQQIYGETVPDPVLAADIKEKGILSSLTILDDGTLLSGHQRYACAVQIGLDEVPVTIFQSSDDMEIAEALITANLQRQKTNEQKAREYTKLRNVSMKMRHRYE